MGGTGERWMGVWDWGVWKNNSETGNKRSNVVFSGRKSIKVGACRSPLCASVFLDFFFLLLAGWEEGEERGDNQSKLVQIITLQDFFLSCSGFFPDFLFFSRMRRRRGEGGQSIKVGADHHFALEPLTLFHFFHKKTISQGQHISSQIISFIICFKKFKFNSI